MMGPKKATRGARARTEKPLSTPVSSIPQAPSPRDSGWGPPAAPAGLTQTRAARGDTPPAARPRPPPRRRPPPGRVPPAVDGHLVGQQPPGHGRVTGEPAGDLAHVPGPAGGPPDVALHAAAPPPGRGRDLPP